MTKRKTPKALTEVWAWKEACCREVSHLPIREAIKKRLADCARTGQRLGAGAPEIPACVHRASRVAESAHPYETRRSRKLHR